MDRIGMMLYAKYLYAKQHFKEERGAVDIVAIVVLIGIAVALALLFKDQITNIMNNLFNGIYTKTSNVTDAPTGPVPNLG